MKNFDVPTLVRFVDDEKNLCDGIAYNQEIICLCCGAVVPLEEVYLIEQFSEWLPLEI